MVRWKKVYVRTVYPLERAVYHDEIGNTKASARIQRPHSRQNVIQLYSPAYVTSL
jgi:hypothetical protein